MNVVFSLARPEQVLVRNDDQRVDHFLKRFNTFLGLAHALCALELERFCHDTNRQNAQLASGLRDNWCRAGTGAPTHTRGNETHMCASQVIHDLFDRFFGSRCPDRWPRARAQSLGDPNTHLNFCGCVASLQGLRICIRNNEFRTLKLFLNHIVDCIAAGTAHTKYGDPWLQLFMRGHR